MSEFIMWANAIRPYIFNSQLFNSQLFEMLFAINLNPTLPVRKEPSETSEMVTQLLFGEIFTCVQTANNWCEIKNFADEYAGWVDYKMVTFIAEQEFTDISARQPHFVFSPVAKIKNVASPSPFLLTCGSAIPNYNEKEKSFSVGGRYFFLLEGEIDFPKKDRSTLLQVARSFLHAPYLWGGKSLFGIDCSGFVQIVMRLFNQSLPRDAKDQALVGHEIAFADRQPGDLAFFRNEHGKIIHVGIIMENGKIIHASGCVRIDTLTEIGVFSEEFNKQTHTLRKIMRLF